MCKLQQLKINILGLFLTICLSLTARSQNFTLSVQVESIVSAKGNILLALFDKEADFPDNSKGAVSLKQLAAKNGSLVVKFENLPKGNYALAVFHDVNGDGKLNKNPLGIPKEAYGFSNNARPAFRAPTFGEAGISLEKNQFIVLKIK
jgi:uncharacterized protein (DUF2141 family)